MKRQENGEECFVNVTEVMYFTKTTTPQGSSAIVFYIDGPESENEVVLFYLDEQKRDTAFSMYIGDLRTYYSRR